MILFKKTMKKTLPPIFDIETVRVNITEIRRHPKVELGADFIRFSLRLSDEGGQYLKTFTVGIKQEKINLHHLKGVKKKEGKRIYFVCPKCKKPRKILYLKKYDTDQGLLCESCHGLRRIEHLGSQMKYRLNELTLAAQQMERDLDNPNLLTKDKHILLFLKHRINQEIHNIMVFNQFQHLQRIKAVRPDGKIKHKTYNHILKSLQLSSTFPEGKEIKKR